MGAVITGTTDNKKNEGLSRTTFWGAAFGGAPFSFALQQRR